VRATYRIVRALAGLVLLALSVSWLLLRRRRGPVGPPSPARQLGTVPPISILDPPRRRAAAQQRARARQPHVDVPPVEPIPPILPADPRPIPVPTDALPAQDSAPPSIPDPAENGITPADELPALVEEALAETPVEVAQAEGANTEETRAEETRAEETRVQPDDLRAIRGIGPATEAALHELGIRTFRQLAVLDGAAREELRVALHDSRHRIEREDWVGQAAELHRAKYGEVPLRPV
jgi:predicted flap endonuclease-1-like 5' DNA nuclease